SRQGVCGYPTKEPRVCVSGPETAVSSHTRRYSESPFPGSSGSTVQGEAQEWDTTPPGRGWQPGEVNTEIERPGDADDEGPAAEPDQEQLRARTTRRLERSIGSLGTAAVARMEERLGWFRRMSAQDRSWIGLVAQSGVAAFVDWFRNPVRGRPAITVEAFGTARRGLTR